MTQSVNNGSLVEIEASDFVGQAGYTNRKGVEMVAYIPNRIGRKLEPGAQIKVDNQVRQVAEVTKSAYVDRMNLVRLKQEEQ